MAILTSLMQEETVNCPSIITIVTKRPPIHHKTYKILKEIHANSTNNWWWVHISLQPNSNHPTTQLSPSYFNPTQLSPFYFNTTQLTPSYFNPTHLTPSHPTEPIPLQPNQTHPILLQPNPTEPIPLN